MAPSVSMMLSLSTCQSNPAEAASAVAPSAGATAPCAIVVSAVAPGADDCGECCGSILGWPTGGGFGGGFGIGPLGATDVDPGGDRRA